MLGKGDVGKVYLVREKKTEKLFAMKGMYNAIFFLPIVIAFLCLGYRVQDADEHCWSLYLQSCRKRR